MTLVEVQGTDLDEIRSNADRFAVLVAREIRSLTRQASAQLNSTRVIVAQGAPVPVTPDDLNWMPTSWLGRITVALLPFLARIIRSAVRMQVSEVNTALGRPVIAAFDESIVTRVLLAGAENRLVGIGDEVWANARAALSTGVAEGKSIPDIARDVRQTAAISTPRATAVARTEVIGASNKSSLEVMRASGLVAQKSWIATFDRRVRLTHIAAHGQTVNIDAKFTIGAAQLDHPGDFDGPAGETVNCRCALGYVVDEDVPEQPSQAVIAAVFQFDPAQPRDEEGRWTDSSAGMPDDVLSIPLKVQGGQVSVSTKPDSEDRATLTVGDRSVDLDSRDLRELKSSIISAQFDDQQRAGADGVYRTSRTNQSTGRSDILVSIRPVPGAFITEEGQRIDSLDDAPEGEEVYNAEFDLVVNEGEDTQFDDEPSIRVSLSDLDPSRQGSIYSTLTRATDARRVETGSGPVDVYSPRFGAVGLRTQDNDGNTKEVVLNARSYRRIDGAINDVLFGDDEDDDLSVPRDESRVVDTSAGKLRVHFEGRRVGRDWDGTLTLSPDNDDPSWRIAADGPRIDDFHDALQSNGEAAGVTGN